jgi:dTDP-4-dehydrorhamnose reductase
MRILVTGASGMLGSTLSIELSKSYNVFATGKSKISLPVKYKIFDLLNESYKELINWARPDLIIHCAAITNGNYCQENPSEAFNVNGMSMNKFLRATNNSVKIIYISTDAVFNSSAHLANEKNCIEPQSIYGKSKELGEFFLLNSTRDYLILRTTIVGLNSYTNNKSFLEWIINSVKTKQRISLFNDVLFSPITIWCLISEIIFLISQNLICSKIFHIAGGQTMTKYEFGKSIIEELSLDKDFIMEGSISELKEKAKRSKDQSLDSSYYQNTFNRRLPDIKDTITIIKNKINE